LIYAPLFQECEGERQQPCLCGDTCFQLLNSHLILMKALGSITNGYCISVSLTLLTHTYIQ